MYNLQCKIHQWNFARARSTKIKWMNTQNSLKKPLKDIYCVSCAVYVWSLLTSSLCRLTNANSHCNLHNITCCNKTENVVPNTSELMMNRNRNTQCNTLLLLRLSDERREAPWIHEQVCEVTQADRSNYDICNQNVQCFNDICYDLDKFAVVRPNSIAGRIGEPRKVPTANPLSEAEIYSHPRKRVGPTHTHDDTRHIVARAGRHRSPANRLFQFWNWLETEYTRDEATVSQWNAPKMASQMLNHNNVGQPIDGTSPPTRLQAALGRKKYYIMIAPRNKRTMDRWLWWRWRLLNVMPFMHANESKSHLHTTSTKCISSRWWQ